jgi:NADH:ubiquinone oxidoreductase subunit F (NADH-binding)/(2Fe-2S) ferredoxin/Pyruvate/2-oxoacid:ferredoxin oxidoreductase delta subunit
MYRMHLMICAGTGCVSNKSFEVRDALKLELAKHQLQDEVQVVPTGCQGFCAQGPIVLVQPDGIFYQLITVEDVPFLVEEHCLKGRPVEKLMYKPEKKADVIPKINEIEFFKKQKLIALANRGIINPESIDEYIARGGYKALSKSLTEMTPDTIISVMKESGLRGRGGAGFLTGQKWLFAKNAPGDEKYVICNADEGDPGAFMDRSVVESDPHAVLEGMCIGAYAIGAHQGFVYIRDEYPLALTRILKAIEDATEYGLLGTDILGTGFDFNIRVNRGAGAFVCGEETALIASLEGKRGMPSPRPPYPANSGFRGKPTNINNVETFANVRHIITNGAEWFSSIGTETSKGTKVFSLVGKVNNTGLVEVPMGITLREMVFEIGGGIPNGKKFKAVQTGGPSGGCIPESMLDLAIDYESLAKVGSIVGSGGMIVLDEDNCMVEVARYFQEFIQSESCGQCVPCRVGSKHLVDILARICAGEGEESDINKLKTLSRDVKAGSLCALGQTAPNPVLTTLKYFEDEYIAHIREKRCPAGVCKNLLTYRIDPELCIGCTKCAKSCPVNVISGERKEPHVIDAAGCIKCGSCAEVCPVNAVIVS